MKKYSKVIFVCNGNTCRSPIAATIMGALYKGRDLNVASRGMVVLFEEPYNPKAIAICFANDYIMPSKSSKQLMKEDFGNDVLVLTMDMLQKNKIYSEYENAINVYTISEYVSEDEENAPIDPYGKGIEEYKNCYERLFVLVSKVAEKLKLEESE